MSLRGEVAERSKAAVLKTFRHVYHWPLALVGCAHNAHTFYGPIVPGDLGPVEGES